MDPLPLIRMLALTESIALIAFSLLPQSALPSTGIAAPRMGDLEHFLAYVVYGCLLTLSLALNPRKRLLLVAAIGGGMGLLTETIQLFVPTRFFDPLDLLADLFGAAAGGALSAFLLKRFFERGTALGDPASGRAPLPERPITRRGAS